MSLETRGEKIFYRAFIPVVSVIIGALATVVFSGSACQLGSETDFISILSSQELGGPEKLKALEIYKEVTDRPWGILRSLVSSLLFVIGAGTAYWAFNRN